MANDQIYGIEITADAKAAVANIKKLDLEIKSANKSLFGLGQTKINNLFQGLSDSGKKETDKLKDYFKDLQNVASQKIVAQFEQTGLSKNVNAQQINQVLNIDKTQAQTDLASFYAELEAREKLSGTQKLDLDLGSAFKNLDELQKKSNDLNTNIRRLGQTFKDVGKDFSLYLTAPLALFAGLSIKQFADAEKSQVLFGQALKNNNKNIKTTAEGFAEAAKQLSRLSTFDDDDILKNVTQKLVLADNVSEGVILRAQQNIADFAAQSGFDLSSAADVVTKALSDPEKGILQLERVGKQFGLNFTPEVTKGIQLLAKSGDFLGAQEKILEKIESKFKGSAANVAKSTSGQFDQLKNELGNVGEEVGKILSDVLLPFKSIAKSISISFVDASDGVKIFATSVGAILAFIGPLLVGIGALLAVIPSISAGFAIISAKLLLLAPAIAFVKAAFVSIGAVISGLTLPITAAIIAIGILIVTLVKSLLDAKTFSDGFILFGKRIGLVINELFLVLLKANNKLVQFFGGKGFDTSASVNKIAELNQEIDDLKSKPKTEVIVDVKLTGAAEADKKIKALKDKENAQNDRLNQLALEKEFLKTQEQQNKNSYDQGLITLKQFQDKKTLILNKNYQNDLELARTNVLKAQDEFKLDPTKLVDLNKAITEVKKIQEAFKRAKLQLKVDLQIETVDKAIAKIDLNKTASDNQTKVVDQNKGQFDFGQQKQGANNQATEQSKLRQIQLENLLTNANVAQKESINQKIFAEKEFQNSMIQSSVEASKQVLTIGGAFDNIRAKIIEAGGTIGQVQNIVLQFSENLANGLGGAFDDLISGAKTFEEAIGGAIESSLKFIAKYIQQLLIAQAIDALFASTKAADPTKAIQIGIETTAIVAQTAAVTALTGVYFGLAAAKAVAGATGGVAAAQGGYFSFADGGSVNGAGTSTSDSIPARLSNGEFVMPAVAVKKYGASFFEGLRVNSLRGFAQGGLATNAPAIPTLNQSSADSAPTSQSLRVEVINKGTPQQAEQSSFDPKTGIIQVILNDLKRGGQISQGLQGTFGLSR